MEVYITAAKPRKYDYRVRVTNGYKMVQAYVKGGQEEINNTIAQLKLNPWLTIKKNAPTP